MCLYILTSMKPSTFLSITFLYTMGSATSAKPRRGYVFKDCALVSNSAEMKGSKLGGLIDAHSTVIRLNFPKIIGFGQDVGTRTNLVWTNDRHMRQLHDRYKRPESIYGEYYPLEYKRASVFMNSVFEKATTPTIALNACRGFATKFRLSWKCKHAPWSSYRMAQKMAVHVGMPGHFPSTGWHAVSHLIRICQQLTLYGFVSGIATGHYWVDGIVDTPKHKMHQEHEMLTSKLPAFFQNRLVAYRSDNASYPHIFE